MNEHKILRRLKNLSPDEMKARDNLKIICHVKGVPPKKSKLLLDFYDRALVKNNIGLFLLGIFCNHVPEVVCWLADSRMQTVNTLLLQTQQISVPTHQLTDILSNPPDNFCLRPH